MCYFFRPLKFHLWRSLRKWSQCRCSSSLYNMPCRLMFNQAHYQLYGFLFVFFFFKMCVCVWGNTAKWSEHWLANIQKNLRFHANVSLLFKHCSNPLTLLLVWKQMFMSLNIIGAIMELQVVKFFHEIEMWLWHSPQVGYLTSCGSIDIQLLLYCVAIEIFFCVYSTCVYQ